MKEVTDNHKMWIDNVIGLLERVYFVVQIIRMV